MALPFPSLEFFEALKKRTTEDPVTFERLGTCDTSFGVKIGDDLIRSRFEVYECVEIAEASDAGNLDFVLAGSPDTWNEMMRSILENGGADGDHTLNTLSHVGDVIAVEYGDAEGHDCFYRFMATIQEFFDQACHLDVAVG